MSDGLVADPARSLVLDFELEAAVVLGRTIRNADVATANEAGRSSSAETATRTAAGVDREAVRPRLAMSSCTRRVTPMEMPTTISIMSMNVLKTSKAGSPPVRNPPRAPR